MRDLGPTEVGGFGLSSQSDLFRIEDIRLVRQRATAITVQFEDAAVADHFDAMVDQGLTPESFARVWVHTHPGSCALPSGTDEETFERCFGSADWSVMFILAEGGQTYARLRFRAGPGGEFQVPVEVSFDEPFQGSDRNAWETEYRNCVVPLDHEYGDWIGQIDGDCPKGPPRSDWRGLFEADLREVGHG